MENQSLVAENRSNTLATPLPTFQQRIIMMQRLTGIYDIPIDPALEENQHFWFLVSREYQNQITKIPKKLKTPLSQDKKEKRDLAISNAVEKASNIFSLEKEAITDNLTGVYNRRFLDRYLINLLNHTRDPSPTDAVILFDIDLFKQVNDKLGHPDGDKVLKTLAQIVQGFIRGTDLFGRFGGEEFMIIMPEINRGREEEDNRTTILARIDSLREKIEKELHTAIVGEDKRNLINRVTASFGVFFVDGTTVIKNEKQLTDKVYSPVDALLYQAKQAGRNRVVGPDGVFSAHSSHQPH